MSLYWGISKPLTLQQQVAQGENEGLSYMPANRSWRDLFGLRLYKRGTPTRANPPCKGDGLHRECSPDMFQKVTELLS